MFVDKAKSLEVRLVLLQEAIRCLLRQRVLHPLEGQCISLRKIADDRNDKGRFDQQPQKTSRLAAQLLSYITRQRAT